MQDTQIKVHDRLIKDRDRACALWRLDSNGAFAVFPMPHAKPSNTAVFVAAFHGVDFAIKAAKQLLKKG